MAEATYKHGGIKKVEYQTPTGGAWGSPVNLGAPLTDGGVGFELPETETGEGKKLYSGKKCSHTFKLTDLTKFVALETLMKADTSIDVRVYYLNGDYDTITTDAIPMVKRIINSQTGQRNAFELKVDSFQV